MIIEGFELVQTCGSCPEQYDVYKDGERVAYLRLRHGDFTAQVPWVGGRQVYAELPEGDGEFEDHERERYLSEAIQAVKEYLEVGK